MQAIILAGGKGTRLRPFTTTIPKPLMPIGDLPILEVVLRQLKYYGFKDVVITVNHLAELIMSFFGNGSKLGLHITYSREDVPLGTAGSLSLVEHLEDNFVVMNGDLLTTLKYADLLNAHVQQKNDVTISVHKKKVNIDLGVIKSDKEKFVDYIEKPVYDFEVSMGIYAFNKRACEGIRKDQYLDMPSLILRLHQEGRAVRCYRGDYYWLDIGRVEDYETAVDVFNKKKSEFLPV